MGVKRAAMFSVLLAACGAAKQSASVADGATSVQVDWSADPIVFHVYEQTRFYDDSMAKAQVAGQDGANDIVLPNGQALWIFGDTGFTGGGQGLTNSAMVVTPTGPSGQYLVDTSGKARTAIPLVSPEDWAGNRIWPGAGVVLGDRLYTYFSRIQIAGSAGQSAAVGLAWASIDDPTFTFTRVTTAIPASPTWAIRRSDGTIFLYGIRQDSQNAFDSWVDLWSVPDTQIEDPSAYQRVNASFVDGVWGQASVAWNAYLQKFVMLTVGNVFNEPRNLYMRTADDPAGPFSDPIKLAVVPGQTGANWQGLLYCPYLHPELFRDNGKTMVLTFCVVGEQVPYLVEIEFQTTAP